MDENMKDARSIAIEILRKMSMEELVYLAEENQDGSAAQFLKAMKQDSCSHIFVKDPFNNTFECPKCGFQTDGKNLKEWRK